jgi:hypothetical protein
MTLFDEQDREALRLLGFTMSITGNRELAVVQGEMKVLIHTSGDDQFALIITLPNGDGARRDDPACD